MPAATRVLANTTGSSTATDAALAAAASTTVTKVASYAHVALARPASNPNVLQERCRSYGAKLPFSNRPPSVVFPSGKVDPAATPSSSCKAGVLMASAAKNAAKSAKNSCNLRPTSKVPAARQGVCYVGVCVCVHMSGLEITYVLCTHARACMSVRVSAVVSSTHLHVYIHVHTCFRGARTHTLDLTATYRHASGCTAHA